MSTGLDYSWVGLIRVSGNGQAAGDDDGAEVVDIDQGGKKSRTWFNMNGGSDKGWRRARPGEMERQFEAP